MRRNNANANSYCVTNGNCKCHAYGNGNCICNCYAYFDGETDAYGAPGADSEAASDASAAPDSITVTGTITAGTREQNSRVPRFQMNWLLRKSTLG